LVVYGFLWVFGLVRKEGGVGGGGGGGRSTP